MIAVLFYCLSLLNLCVPVYYSSPLRTLFCALLVDCPSFVAVSVNQ